MSLTLEDYPGMTERQIARHVAAAQARWPLLGTTMVHRIGTLSMREAIVLVAVASRRRDGGVRGCRIPDGLPKARAPFWNFLARRSATGQVALAKLLETNLGPERNGPLGTSALRPA